MGSISYYDNDQEKPREVSTKNPLPVVLVSETHIDVELLDPTATLEDVVDKVNEIITSLKGG